MNAKSLLSAYVYKLNKRHQQIVPKLSEGVVPYILKYV